MLPFDAPFQLGTEKVWKKVRDILYNTDVINPIVKSIVHGPVGKLL